MELDNGAGDETDDEIDATRASIVDDDLGIGIRFVVSKMVDAIVDGNPVLGVVGSGVDDVAAAIVVLVMNFFSLRTIIESAILVVLGVELIEDDGVDDSVMYGAAARETALAAVRTVLCTNFDKMLSLESPCKLPRTFKSIGSHSGAGPECVPSTSPA